MLHSFSDKKKIRKNRNKEWSFFILLLFLLPLFSIAQTTVTFTTAGSTSWTVPVGVTSVTVECWGGGGAGGGNNTNADGGGGGGGGAYSKSTTIAVTPGNNYTVTVGAGGTGGTGNGTAGGDSWFINTTTILAKGGTFGRAPVNGSAGVAGTGGAAGSGVGTTKYSGGNGGPGNNANTGFGGGGGSSAGTAANGGIGGTPTFNAAGSGGVAPTGGGNGGDGGNNPAIGNPGSVPGGAGGGSGENASGGNGAVGKVTITYTLPSCPISTTIAPTGNQSVCQNASASLLTATVTSSAGSGTPTILYQWYYNNTNSNTIAGATSISGATSQTYTPPTATVGTRYYFCVGYATNNGCSQTATTQSLASNTVQVTVNALPTAVTVSGGGTFCGSATLTASGGTGGTIYFQGTTSNGTSTATPSTSQVVTSSGTYYFRAMSIEGCWGTQGSATVTINPNPTITLGTDPSVCRGTTSANLSYSATTGSPNQYSIDYDATAQSQGFVDITNASLPASPIVLTVPANATPGTYNYTVRVRNSTTGCVSTLYSKTITVNPPAPATPGTISGQTTVNSNTSGLVYSISAVTYATSYNWTVPTGWIINSGQGTTSINITSGSAGQNGNISVTASNSCGTSAASNLAVTVYAGNCPQSTLITPAVTQIICQHAATNILTAAITLSGGTGTPTLQYQWYYNNTNSNTIAGATKLAGETNTTYTPQNTTTGTRYYFCVGYASDNGCGQTDASQVLASNTVQVTVNPLVPSTPGIITGPASVSPNVSGIIYSISTVAGASSYTWTVPTGWTITAGQGTISITVTSGSNGQNGSITVTASNSCGTSAVSSLSVSVIAVPPTITLGSIPSICQGTTSANLSYSATTNNPDKYSIDYNTLANTAGFADVVDANLPVSPIVLVVPATASGNYFGTLRVKNSSTGLYSINYNIMLTVLTIPATPGAISGLTTVGQNLPGYTYSIGTVSGTTSYTWTVPTGWTITAGQTTKTLTVTSGAAGQNGNITVRAINTCGTSAVSSLAVTSVVPADHITYNCNSCHIFHNATGGALTFTTNSNLCMSCHVSGGAAAGKPFSDAMKAVPGVSGTSHNWNVAAVNGTRETLLPTNSEMLKRIDTTGGGNKIICSTCHNQHNPNTNGKYLRISNTGDALCKDCHTPRNVGRYLDNTTNNKGSHPVGLTYPTANSNYKSTPTAPFSTPGGKIECSSCHQTHNATTTDGNLLKATTNAAMCTSCHNYSTHNNMDCLKCHQTHNTNKSNVYMIRNTIATPNSGNKTVVFTSRTGTNSFADGNATYDGICEVCHTTTSHFRNNGGGGDQNHTSQGGGIPGGNCTSCHSHSSNFATPNCTACHNAINTPTTGIFTTDAHTTHVTRYGYACTICHFGQGSGGASEPTHPSGGLGEVTFDVTSLAKRFGQDAAVPAYNNTAKTCTNIYCHSNGRSAYRGTDGTYTWSNTTGSQAPTYTTTLSWYTGKITACTSCHNGAGNMTSPYLVARPGVNQTAPVTGSHGTSAHNSNTQDFSAAPYLSPFWVEVQCFWCHDGDGSSINGPRVMGTYGTSFHVDGNTYFKPLNFANGGTMANGLSYSSNGAAAHCGNGKQCW